jgi:DNA helicase-2/ATP-dependent DNA helicase PcrA
MTWNIILGPPGTGKTTKLLNLTEDYLKDGVAPHKIGYLAFTKKAANEALERASDRFDLDEDDLTFFRTIHSLCYHWLGLKTADIMARAHYKEFSKLMGEPLNGQLSKEEGAVFGLSKGDQMLFMENIARNKKVSIREQWEQANLDIPWNHVNWFCTGLHKFKEERFLKDYTDMLYLFLKEKTKPSLDVLIVDEAQDLSKLQWDCIKKLAEGVDNVHIAGDDDQAIYQWAGADVETFIQLEGEVTVLENSYRIPKKVHEVAQGILNRIPVENRRVKSWTPRSVEGEIMIHISHEHLDFSDGEWLVLARNGYILNRVEKFLQQIGFIYARNNVLSVKQELLDAIGNWELLRKNRKVSASKIRDIYFFMSVGKGVARGHKKLPGVGEDELLSIEDLKEKHGLLTDSIWHEALDRVGATQREYLIACLRRGERVSNPRIRLSTIHAAKGGEADNVVVFTDISVKTWNELYSRPDGENRAFYVAVTRTRKNLHIVQPNTSKFFRPIL